jgi:hypothetical protein
VATGTGGTQPPAAGTPSPSGPADPRTTSPLQAGSAANATALSTGLRSPLAPTAGAGGGSMPTSTAPAPSRVPAGPGGSTSGGGAPGSGSGGSSSGRGLQSGVAAALMTLLTLVLLRLARCAGARPIWRSYLPEVPPA